MTAEQMRQYLRTYRILIKEINARVEHLAFLKNDILLPLQDLQIGERALQSAQKTMLQRLTELQTEIEYFEGRAKDIEKLINKLKNEERLVIYARYILGLKWLDIPEVLNYEIAQCQRLERKAINNLIKVQQKGALLW